MRADERRLEWGNVDDDADRAEAYLDTVTGLEAVRAFKHRSHRLLRPEPGDRILDAGCGVGDDVLALAERVGPDGAVVGLDRSESMVAEARERAGKAEAARFHVGDVMQLPFEDGTFDACRADRLFQHLEDPRGALAEMRRVTRPGGRVAVSDSDWATLVVAAPGADAELTEHVTDPGWVNSVAPRVGRRLYALARDEGVVDVGVDADVLVLTAFDVANEVFYLADRLAAMREAGVVSAEAADRWLAAVRRAGEADRLLCSMTGVTVAGTVPREEGEVEGETA